MAIGNLLASIVMGAFVGGLLVAGAYALPLIPYIGADINLPTSNYLTLFLYGFGAGFIAELIVRLAGV